MLDAESRVLPGTKPVLKAGCHLTVEVGMGRSELRAPDPLSEAVALVYTLFQVREHQMDLK